MEVLGTIAVLVLLLGVYVLLERLDNYANYAYGHKFFTIDNFILIVVAYLFLFFGHSSYVEALKNSGDLLNGVVLVFIGVGILLYKLYDNMKKTNIVLGIFMTLIQFVLYVVMAVVSVFFMIVFAIFLGGTKPVYVINK